MTLLKECCSLLTDGDWIESKDQSESGIRLIQTGNIGNGEFLEKEGRAKYISEETFRRLGCTEIFPGDILISRLPEPVGRACLIPDKAERMITAVDCSILRIDESVINKKFFLFFLKSSKYYNQLTGKLAGTTRVRISRKNLEKVSLTIPSMAEQNRIANVLGQLDRIIKARKAQLSALDELVKARFVEMFGDPVKNPKGWKIQCFEKLSELITDGEHATPRRVDKGIYLLSARNVLNHAIQLKDVDYIDQNEYERISKRIIPQEGDILISCSGSVGRCCSVPAGLKFQMVRSAALIRFKKDILPKFAEYMIVSDYVQQQIEASKTASSQANLFQGKIAKLMGFVPPIELQKEFSDFVAQVDKTKLAIQKSLEKTQLLFDSLMQEYFG